MTSEQTREYIRERSVLVHVSLDIVERFVPRIPETRMWCEDNSVPRICVSDCLLRAINAAPQLAEALGVLAEYRIPAVLHAYYFHPEGQRVIKWLDLAADVPDVHITHESWIMSPCPFIRRDYLVRNLCMHSEDNQCMVLSAKFIRTSNTDNWDILASRLRSDSDSANRLAEGLRKVGVTYSRLFIPPMVPQFEEELKKIRCIKQDLQ